jgi:hypothetical protein
MAKVSKFIKLNKDVLLEYVYNDGNLISDSYNILVDSRNGSRSYIAGDTTLTGNGISNQLFSLDQVGFKYGKVDTSYYSYLQTIEYSQGAPIRHDTLKFHIPTNWTFGEYLGFYIKVYTTDPSGSNMFTLSNFYFDMSDSSTQYLMNYTQPPLFFQEKLWGKTVQVDVPSVSQVAAQIANNVPKSNTINYNLTNGLGLSSTAPIFIDFVFVAGAQTINGITTYTLSDRVTTTVPQTPEFESLGLVVEHSSNGDFFEIYGTYNGNISEFKKFIDDSVKMGNKYYVQYTVTMYEQNTRGRSLVFTLTDGFNESIEYRPIIKYSTTTAVIDVEMRLIDEVDDSYIMRRASYGMLQDEIGKFSLNMSKINLANAMKPKIYNIKNNIDSSLLGKTDSQGRPLGTRGRTGTGFGRGLSVYKGPGSGAGAGGGGGAGFGTGTGGSNVIKVPYPVLVDKSNVVAKSENDIINGTLYYGIGKIQIQVFPFDSIVSFTIATSTPTGNSLMDLSALGEMKLVIRNDSTRVEIPRMTDAGDDLKSGQVSFKITQGKFPTIKKIFSTGINLFYITATNVSSEVSVYSGLFLIYDSLPNVSALNSAAANSRPSIVQDPTLSGTAIVTQKLVSGGTNPNQKGTQSDLRKKDKISRIGISPRGIAIYSFEYIDSPGVSYQGVMAQELIGTEFEAAVLVMEDGFYGVDYSMIDVDFTKISNNR